MLATIIFAIAIIGLFGGVLLVRELLKKYRSSKKKVDIKGCGCHSSETCDICGSASTKED